MKHQPQVFRRQDTGEEKEFWPDGYRYEITDQHDSEVRPFHEARFFRAADGDRIDLKPDGTYQEKWGVVWLPV